MTFPDLFKELLDTSKERMKTPISGAYSFSFVIWNWRPMVLLIFEDNTITNKIIVINHEYCNIMAVIGPLLLGLFFTVCVPYIMLGIDKLLYFAKKTRVKTLYISKGNVLSEQITLVDKELELQDKRNRSKTSQDFENEINKLQQLLETEKSSNKILIDGLENDINELTKRLEVSNVNSVQSSKTLINDHENKFFKIVENSKLSTDDLYSIVRIEKTIEEPINIKLSSTVIDFLMQQKFITFYENKIYLTFNGIDFLNFLENKLKD